MHDHFSGQPHYRPRPYDRCSAHPGHDAVHSGRVENKSHAEPIDAAELHKFLCDERYGNLTEEQKEFVRLRRDEMRSACAGMVCQLLLCEEMLRRNMVADFQTYCSVFCPEGGGMPWALHRAG